MRRLAIICLILTCVAQSSSAFNIMEDPVPLLTKGFEGTLDAQAKSLNIDTFNVYTPSSIVTIRRIKGARNFKGPYDDTLRLFVVQSASPRKALMLTDTASRRFSVFRVDILTPTLGSGPQGLAAGDLNGDGYTEVYIGTFGSNPQRLYRIRWSGGFILDSLVFDQQDSIFNLAIGDCNNDGSQELLIPGKDRVFILKSWVGDNVIIDTISVGGRVTAVAIGDVHPDKPGNEIYVAGTNLYMIYSDGGSYSVTTIYENLTLVHSMAIGDVDPLRDGQELVLVHGGTDYQVSLWNWNRETNEFDGRAWRVSTVWTSHFVNNPADVAVGDISDASPGEEVVLASGIASANQNTPSYIFWIESNGTAYKMELPEPTPNRAECGVYIGDINKFSSHKLEFLLTGGANSGRVLLYQERGTKDLQIVSVRQAIPVFIENRKGSFDIVLRNKGEIAIDSPTIYYSHWISDQTGGETYDRLILPSQQCTLRLTPNLEYQFPIQDSLFVEAYLPDDATPSDNKKSYYFEIWPDSTVAASNFNSLEDFPPVGWSTEILLGDSSWNWYDTCVVVDRYVDYLAAPVFEGEGVAGYPSHIADLNHSARLITNNFSVGANRKRVIVSLYFLHSKYLGYDPSSDRVVFEVKENNRFRAFDSLIRFSDEIEDMSTRWTKYELVAGDFPAGSEIAISFKAISGYGANMFIDSVWIFTTAPGPVFSFDINSDVGVIEGTDNFWIRIKPDSSAYPIDSAYLFYFLHSKNFQGVREDSVGEDGYYYFTVENNAPNLDQNLEFYFVFYENSPWKYTIRYPITGEFTRNILPIANKLPSAFALDVKGSRGFSGYFDFTYAIPKRSDVEISVYSISGQKLATLVQGVKDPGYYSLKWDGRSSNGSKLPSGVYFVKMVTPKKSFTQRVLITR